MYLYILLHCSLPSSNASSATTKRLIENATTIQTKPPLEGDYRECQMKIAIKLNQQIQRRQSDTVESENCECVSVCVSVWKS